MMLCQGCKWWKWKLMGPNQDHRMLKVDFQFPRWRVTYCRREPALSQVRCVCCWNVRLVVKGGGRAKGGEVGEVVWGPYSEGLAGSAQEFRCYPVVRGESFWSYRRREAPSVMILVEDGWCGRKLEFGRWVRGLLHLNPGTPWFGSTLLVPSVFELGEQGRACYRISRTFRFRVRIHEGVSELEYMRSIQTAGGGKILNWQKWKSPC